MEVPHHSNCEFYFNGLQSLPSQFHINTAEMRHWDQNAAVPRVALLDPLVYPKYAGVPGKYEILVPRDYFFEIMESQFRDFIEESIDERRSGILDESQHWIVDAPGAAADIRRASNPFLETFFTEFMWIELLEQLSSRVCGRRGTICVCSVDSLRVGAEGVRMAGNAFKFFVHPVTNSTGCLESG